MIPSSLNCCTTLLLHGSKILIPKIHKLVNRTALKYFFLFLKKSPLKKKKKKRIAKIVQKIVQKELKLCIQNHGIFKKKVLFHKSMLIGIMKLNRSHSKKIKIVSLFLGRFYL